jgi:hypothetical protein
VGFSQNTLDELESEKMGEIVRGFNKSKSSEEAVMGVGLMNENQMRMISDSQLKEWESERE